MDNKTIRREIGVVIYKYRHHANLTQEQLAERLDVSVQQVRNYESGRCCPTLQRARQLCTLLSIPLNELLK
jgi:DNA-binding XRE family transcriptional regulator